MKLIRTSILIASIGISSVALANDMYFEAGFAATKITSIDKGVSKGVSLDLLLGKLGTKFNDNFAAEARIGFSLGDDTIEEPGMDVITVKLNKFYGAYLKVGAPVSDSFYPYAVLGHTKIDVQVSSKNFTDSKSKSGASFGLGADFNLDRFTLNIEYLKYIDKDEVKMSGISIGLSDSF